MISSDCLHAGGNIPDIRMDDVETNDVEMIDKDVDTKINALDDPILRPEYQDDTSPYSNGTDPWDHYRDMREQDGYRDDLPSRVVYSGEDEDEDNDGNPDPNRQFIRFNTQEEFLDFWDDENGNDKENHEECSTGDQVPNNEDPLSFPEVHVEAIVDYITQPE